MPKSRSFFSIIISGALALLVLFFTGGELKVFCEVINEYVLRTTPLYLIAALIIIPSAFISASGYEVRARMGELLFFVVFIPFLILLASLTASVISGGEITNPMRFFKLTFDGMDKILAGALDISLSFFGILYVLFAYPFLNSKKGLVKSSMAAVATIMILCVFITFLSLFKFGQKLLSIEQYPFMQLFDQRYSALIISFWIVSTFFITNAGLFFSSYLLQKASGRQNRRPFLISSTVIVFILCLLLTGCHDMTELENRQLVQAMGIDIEDERYTVTLLMPSIEGSSNKQEHDEKALVKSGTGKTLKDAFEVIEHSTSKRLFMRQMVLCILGESVEKQALQTIQQLYENKSINKDMMVMTGLKASEIIETRIEGEPTVGLYTEAYARNNQKESISVQELYKLLLEDENGLSQTPRISVTSSGGIKEFKVYSKPY